MPAKDADPLFATTWVHLFEEDSAQGEVYRPEEHEIPLSRRPRQRIQLHADGSGCVLKQGADDRYVEEPATWADAGSGVVIHVPGRGAHLRVVSQSPSRLVVQSGKTGG